jgi:putative colanic acid biosynthesis acetyltransferase WcaB
MKTDDEMTPGATARGFWHWAFQDWKVNSTYPDSQVILVLFRIAQWSFQHWGRPGMVLCLAYRLLVSLFFSVELPYQAQIGPRLRVFHPHSIVLNPGVSLGSDCVLRQSVTIGNSTRRDGTDRGVARAGNSVEFGAGCVVVGGIRIGDHARVAALALVVEDVPDYGVVRGNPAVLVRVDRAADER